MQEGLKEYEKVEQNISGRRNFKEDDNDEDWNPDVVEA